MVPRTTVSVTATTKTAHAAAAKREISNWKQKEEEEAAEITGQSFFLMPAPLTTMTTPAPLLSSALTDLKLDKHTACMW